MGKVVIGVDPHKASNTAVVIDGREQVLAQKRFANDQAGYRRMKSFARSYPHRVWAVEGARGVETPDPHLVHDHSLRSAPLRPPHESHDYARSTLASGTMGTR